MTTPTPNPCPHRRPAGDHHHYCIGGKFACQVVSPGICAHCDALSAPPRPTLGQLLAANQAKAAGCPSCAQRRAAKHAARATLASLLLLACAALASPLQAAPLAEPAQGPVPAASPAAGSPLPAPAPHAPARITLVTVASHYWLASPGARP